MIESNGTSPEQGDDVARQLQPSPTRRKPVGITKGPGETTHEYTFVSRDDEQVLKNGEYVYYELTDPEQAEGGLNNGPAARRVLGRITKRIPLQLYPDTFLGEPEISPAQVAAMVGYNARTNELFEMHVAIMGYYERETASFRRVEYDVATTQQEIRERELPDALAQRLAHGV